MKHKYVYAREKLLIEDECIAFLEDMSLQGWKLKNVFYSIFVFEKCNAPLKYQLDYSDYNEEYIEVITNLGYEYLCLFNNIKFYCHKDLAAVDLQTDPIIQEMTILKGYSTSSILLNFVFILLLYVLSFGDPEYILNQNTVANFYINFNIEVLSWCLYAIIAYSILHIIKKIDIRYKINHGLFNKKSLLCFHPLFHILQLLVLSIIISLILFLLFFGEKSLILLGMYLCGVIISNLANMIFLDQKYNINRNSRKKILLIRLGAYSLLILSMFLIVFPFAIKNKPIFIWTTQEKPYYNYRALESEKSSNIYLTKHEYREEYNPNVLPQDEKIHYETYYAVKDKKIAQIIFEQIVIDNEFYINETNIFHNDTLNITREDYVYKTYEQVKDKFYLYKTAKADICYYYEDRLIAIKNKQILDCTLDNENQIDEILKYYFDKK